jgi:hypothetical protein
MQNAIGMVFNGSSHPTRHNQMLNNSNDDDPIIQLAAGNAPNTLETIQQINTSNGQWTLGVHLAHSAWQQS